MERQEEGLLLLPAPSSSPPPPPSFVWIWRELKLLMRLAGPMIFVGIFLMFIQLSSVMFVGHLDAISLARATIATSFSNVVGISLLTGIATALDTYCGQAYGAKKYQLLGFYLQQGLVGLNLSAIPFAIIYVFVGDILKALGQDYQISIGAGYYTRCLIPALFAIATSQPLVRFLLAQSLVVPVLMCSLLTVVCHLPLSWILVYRSGLGFQGAAVATSVSFWIFALSLAVCVRFSKACEKCRAPWSWQAVKELKAFFQLGIPSGAMTCLEWWCYELLVLLAGLLPNPVIQASTLSICMNTGAVLFQIPTGIGVGTSTRVSNELGSGNPDRARNAVKVALGVAFSEALTLSIILLCIHQYVGRIYSNDAEVIAYVSRIIPMLSANVFLDALQATLSGVARGCGLQKFGAIINLGSYYCVGLPIGCLLAFLTPLQGQGLWAAALCAPFVQASCLAILLFWTNWDKLVLQAAERIGYIKEPLLLDKKHQEVY